MERLNIVFTTDTNYTQHLGVCMYSLLFNNVQEKFDIYIISSEIEISIKTKLQSIAKEFDANIIFLQVNENDFTDLVVNNHFTIANYYRIMIPDLIKKDKVLYLDVDMIIQGSLNVLYNIDITDHYIAAREESTIFNRHKELKMSLSAKYFNSGVMLMNLKKWRTDNISLKVIQFVKENPTVIKHVDQCALNAILNGHWYNIPQKFNVQTENYKEMKKCQQENIIIHFTGPSKPWHFMNKHKCKSLYWKYLSQTPFRDYRYPDLNMKNFILKYTPIKIQSIIGKFLPKSLKDKIKSNAK